MNLPVAAIAQYVFGFLMFFTSLFLILLVLVQRGRGGGLAGAFGGMGGQSAFGTKAGDLFTKLTMGAATFWILLCILAISVLNQRTNPLGGGAAGPAEPQITVPVDPLQGASGAGESAEPGTAGLSGLSPVDGVSREAETTDGAAGATADVNTGDESVTTDGSETDDSENP